MSQNAPESFLASIEVHVAASIPQEPSTKIHYFTFNILRLSFVGGCLHVMYLKTSLWTHESKFKIWIRFDQCLLSYIPFPRQVVAEDMWLVVAEDMR